MNEEENKPKEQSSNNNQSKHIEKGQINETFNYSQRIGDLNNKSQGNYAKPFINEIIPPLPDGDKGKSSSTSNESKE